MANDEHAAGFPADERPETASDTPGLTAQHDEEVELAEAGLGWRQIVMVLGAGMVAAGASAWAMRRRV